MRNEKKVMIMIMILIMVSSKFSVMMGATVVNRHAHKATNTRCTDACL